MMFNRVPNENRDQSFNVYSTNKEDGEPATILVFENFSGPEEIAYFMDLLLQHGIIQPSNRKNLQ